MLTNAPVAEVCHRILIRNLGGEQLELDVKPDTVVSEIKGAVAAKWHVPSAFQQLVLNCTVLQDEQSVAEVFPEFVQRARSADGVADGSGEHDDATPSILFVVSLQAVAEELTAGGAPAKLAALRQLSCLGRKGGEAAISLTLTCLTFQSDRVRIAAVEALSVVAGRGHSSIAAVCERLDDESPSVRQTAFKAIAQMADRGDAAIVACVGRYVVHADPCRSFALEALAAVAKQGDEEAITAIVAHLDDGSAVVRCAAIRALAKISMRGDAKVIEAVVQSVAKQPDEKGKIAALSAICCLSPRGDAYALVAITGCLGEASPAVRREALRTMSMVAKRGDEELIAKVTESLRDSHWNVRDAALRALLALAERGHPIAVEGVMSVLADSEFTVRCAAVRVLASLASHGDARVIEALTECVRDDSLKVDVRHTLAAMGHGSFPVQLPMRGAPRRREPPTPAAGDTAEALQARPPSGAAGPRFVRPSHAAALGRPGAPAEPPRRRHSEVSTGPQRLVARHDAPASAPGPASAGSGADQPADIADQATPQAVAAAHPPRRPASCRRPGSAASREPLALPTVLRQPLPAAS